MATQQVSRTNVWDPVLALVIAFLARAGLPPRDVSEYQENDVLRAIRAQGWEVDLELETDPPGWGAEIRTWWAPGQRQAAYGSGADRVLALIDALRHALTLSTEQESERAFDELAEGLLGMSGKEFMEKYRAGELNRGDSRVEHLHIARPVGW